MRLCGRRMQDASVRNPDMTFLLRRSIEQSRLTEKYARRSNGGQTPWTTLRVYFLGCFFLTQIVIVDVTWTRCATLHWNIWTVETHAVRQADMSCHDFS